MLTLNVYTSGRMLVSLGLEVLILETTKRSAPVLQEKNRRPLQGRERPPKTPRYLVVWGAVSKKTITKRPLHPVRAEGT